MPEAIIYAVTHSGNPSFGESITLAGEGILSPSIVVQRGGVAQHLTYLSPAVWQAYKLGAISVTPTPEFFGVEGDIKSPISGNRAVTNSLTDDYTVTKDDCGKLKELDVSDIVITLPAAYDFASNNAGKFYLTFLARQPNCIFAAPAGVIIENPKLGLDQYSAVTAVLHTVGEEGDTDTVWGLYGGVIDVPT